MNTTCDSSSPSTPCTCGRDTASAGSVTSTVPTPPDPGAGYRLLGEDEVWRKDTDEARASIKDNGWVTLRYTDASDHDTIRTYLAKYPSYIKNYGHLHVRRKIEDPVAELAAKVKAAQDQVDNAQKALCAAEHVYKEATEIRAGDWVIATEDNEAGLTKGKLYQIGRIDGFGLFMLPNDDTKGRTGRWCHTRFRATKALPHEIAAHLAANPLPPPLPKIHGYEGSYAIRTSDIVTYGCASISVALLRGVLALHTFPGNRTLASITLDSGKTLTIDEIRAILAHVDYVNSH